ncbi:MAG: cytochrome c biogenesis protein [Phormidium sp. BM_Day4_Bin.17]|nr:cytochrome c biogenesis protein [Phormidium sp. BM_Day4_Bin.17]UCJ11036.1 MAG: cytochrome c biogenesis protein [Phormidium sp. PBR-2020]
MTELASAPPLRWFRRQILPILANLRLAILLLLFIATTSAIGTVIEQHESLDFYQANYPEDPALLGFLSWKVILAAGLNDVYKTWWFLSLLVLFGSSLAACTFTRQLPALKAARNWKFYRQPRQFKKLALAGTLPVVGENTSDPRPNLDQLQESLEQRRYQVFRDGDSLYARKGLIGRIAPIVVHASMLLILGGAIVGSVTGVMAQEMIPSGETVQVSNFVEAGDWSSPDRFRGWSLKVNRFWIDYTPSGAIDQFYSDLSVVDDQGQERDRKTIYVNEPLRYNGVVFYQTDWSIDSIKIRLNNSPVFQLPMELLDTGGNGRIWGTWIPTKPDLSEGVSLLARDLQGTVLLYDNSGDLVASLRVGNAAEVNGVTLSLLEMTGATGLQIKSDPGIPLVYLGFALLMLSTALSYASHSQIWVLQQEKTLYLGGRTNRAQVSFEREFLEWVDQMDPQPSPGAIASSVGA